MRAGRHVPESGGGRGGVPEKVVWGNEPVRPEPAGGSRAPAGESPPEGTEGTTQREEAEAEREPNHPSRTAATGAPGCDHPLHLAGPAQARPGAGK